MSGTSVDAIDVVLVRVTGAGEQSVVEILHFLEVLFPEEIQQMVFTNAEVTSSNVNDICLLHTTLAFVYADAVRQVCNVAGIAVEAIDLVGMHGQTIHHLPEKIKVASYHVRSTLQIGSGPTLSKLLGVPVVSNFRAGDMAVGGQGAPLVPYIEYLLFRDPVEHRVFINIGGIANITILPASCRMRDVVAFDTGPGNMIVDALVRQGYGKEFDDGGQIASSGQLNNDLFSWLMSHEFFKLEPPKSAGRELFGTEFVHSLLQIAKDLSINSMADIIATTSECTVKSITRALLHRLPPNEPVSLFISGGGAKNRFFVDGIRHNIRQVTMRKISDLGVPSEAKEAVCFALLANEWLFGNPSNLPSVTGAKEAVVLGSFSF